jgi:microsomal dipeptidase-like Zn-dependent dipeptidase
MGLESNSLFIASGNSSGCVRDEAKSFGTRRLFEQIRKIAGIDDVGLGSDFAGATLPLGLEYASTFQDHGRATQERLH